MIFELHFNTVVYFVCVHVHVCVCLACGVHIDMKVAVGLSSFMPLHIIF